jgi:hypothetical protein
VGGKWESLTGLTLSPSNDLYGGYHHSSDCTNAGGSVVSDESNSFCKFNASNCPSTWNQYANWSSTNPKSCTFYGDLCRKESGWGVSCETFSGGTGSCTTASHGFSNTAQDTCSASVPNGCANPIIPCDNAYRVETCYAIITSIGCY